MQKRFAPPGRTESPNFAALLTEALRLHQTGRLADAERLYRRILVTQPDHFDCLHLLGVVFHQRGDHAQAVHHIDLALKKSPDNVFALNNRGNALKELRRFEEALASYDRALALQPDYADGYYNRGNALKELQRFEEALASYDRALMLRPDFAEAHCNRGVILQDLKRFGEALSSYDRALTLRPSYADAHSNRGVTLHELRRLEEALASYDRALALQPNYAAAYSNRGNTLHALGRFDAALASFDRALALWPDYVAALSNRGNALKELKRFEDAVTSCDRALALQPNYAEAHSNRGNALHELSRFEEALASYDRALALRPDYALAHYNRGNALKELKRFEAALASYDRALALQPDYPEALSNRGVALQDLKRIEEALASYDRAVSMRPDYADAHFNAAICRLLMGDFDRGWEQHEWRWQTEHLRNGRKHFAPKLWLGPDDIAGKTVLLHAEQGFGDTIQFCRYAPLVAARGARVVLKVQKPLHELMGTLAGVAQIISNDDPPTDFDLHCPLLSLPLAFGTKLATIPSQTPYLREDTQAAMDWNVRLGPRHRPRIGLAWSGRPAHKNDQNRSIALSAFVPMLAGVDATFVSLQREVRGGDADLLQGRSDIIHFGDELKNFADTAALIANLDLVIAVDTSVVHLAGALAKPVWVLLPFVPDWRWLLDREDSPWYPTARLFRQDQTRGWDNVVARVHGALCGYGRNG